MEPDFTNVPLGHERVARATLDGLSVDKIADKWNLSLGTVMTYQSECRSKYGIPLPYNSVGAPKKDRTRMCERMIRGYVDRQLIAAELGMTPQHVSVIKSYLKNGRKRRR